MSPFFTGSFLPEFQKIQTDLQDDEGLQRVNFVCACIHLPNRLAETDGPCRGGYGNAITAPFLVECRCGPWFTECVSKSIGYRVHCTSEGVSLSHTPGLW